MTFPDTYKDISSSTDKLLAVIRGGRKFRTIDRSECHYQCFDMGSLPVREQHNALRIKILQWAPFESSVFDVVWSGQFAQVWAWNKTVAQTSSDGDKDGKSVSETRFYPQLEKGVRIVACRNGCEGQVWKGGVLNYSRWWRAYPDIEQWSRFIRGTGSHSSHGTPPELSQFELTVQPWGKGSDPNDKVHIRGESLIWKAILLLPLFLLVLDGTEIYLLKNTLSEVTAEITAVSEDLDDLLQSKTRALQYQQELQTIKEIWPQSRQLQLLHEVFRDIPFSDEMIVTRWSYAATDLLIELEGRRIDPTIVVRSLEKKPWITDITTDVSQGNASTLIKMKITNYSE